MMFYLLLWCFTLKKIRQISWCTKNIRTLSYRGGNFKKENDTLNWIHPSIRFSLSVHSLYTDCILAVQ